MLPVVNVDQFLSRAYPGRNLDAGKTLLPDNAGRFRRGQEEKFSFGNAATQFAGDRKQPRHMSESDAIDRAQQEFYRTSLT